MCCCVKFIRLAGTKKINVTEIVNINRYIGKRQGGTERIIETYEPQLDFKFQLIVY